MIKSILTSLSSVLILFLVTFFSFSQNTNDIFETYEEYVDTPREVVYLHLNKSTYIKGENIGFTAYILDKKEKTPSLITTNLYINVSDKNNKVIKQQLVRVANGIASNVIKIDSLFTSGMYNVRAYTNYMRNFNETNFFTEAVKVIDPDVEPYIEKPIVKNSIDAQFLPESGHLLHGIVNNIGVVIKDSQGFGLAYVSGEVLDNNNKVLTTFKTNSVGIGKFPLLANISSTYWVKINYGNENFSFPLGHIVEKNGVVLSVKRLKSKLFASILTNKETLNQLKNNRYTLMLHNGKDYEIMDIYFNDKTVINKVIEFANIPSGTNILTLFDENEKPIAERLFFNYEGIKIVDSNKVSATKNADSITINLNFRGVSSELYNNVSVSVLPQDTRSYNRHNNILSQVFLQPYVKGPIEYGKFYFENIDEKKRYELDNLLLTQGWSSYDWNNLFIPEKLPYPFEQGISIIANVNNKDHTEDTFILHHFKDSQPRYKQVSDGDNSLIFENLFPNETNRIFISRIKNEEDLVPAQLYLQPVPNSIPELRTDFNPLQPKFNYDISQRLKVTAPLNQKLDGVQELEEIVVTSTRDKKFLKTQKLNNHGFGSIKVITQMDRLTYNSLEQYLSFNRVYKGIDPVTSETAYYSSRQTQGPMTVFLDDTPLVSLDIISTYTMADVDYIEINLGGLGEGFRGLNGVIRIYSSQNSFFDSRGNKTAEEFDLPLKFSAKKKFYVPQYNSYYGDFYTGYGTIDWKPDLKINDNGTLSIKMEEPAVPVTLFIEGMVEDGTFIFDKKSISIN